MKVKKIREVLEHLNKHWKSNVKLSYLLEMYCGLEEEKEEEI